jgi:hypothetical protein
MRNKNPRPPMPLAAAYYRLRQNNTIPLQIWLSSTSCFVIVVCEKTTSKKKLPGGTCHGQLAPIIRHHPEYKLAHQDWIQVKLLRRNMEWFDYSILLCPPGRVGFEQIRCHGTHVSHPTQRQDLW